MRRMAGFVVFVAMGALVVVVGVCAWWCHACRKHEKDQLQLESTAKNVMFFLCSGEREFKQQALVDQDSDGVAEYGWLSELAGLKPVRRRNDGTNPFPVSLTMPEDLRPSRFEGGRLVPCPLRGYDFVVFLPFSEVGGMDDDDMLDARELPPDQEDGGVRKYAMRWAMGGWIPHATWSTPLDPQTKEHVIDLQEKHFAVYTIPNGRAHYAPGVFGRYAYVMNEKGEIHCTKLTEGEPYEWDPNPELRYRAAFADDGTTDTYFNNPLADGQKAFDGRVWHKLKPEEQWKPDPQRRP